MNILLVFALLMPWSSAVAAETKNQKSVAIDGDVKNALTLSTEDLAGYQRTQLDVKDKTGALKHYEGVLVSTILEKVVPLAAIDAHGSETRFALLVQGRDGYAVVFSIAEASSKLSQQPIVLADKVDGQPLSEEEGPLRLIVPGDLKPQRWVKQVESIKVKFF